MGHEIFEGFVVGDAFDLGAKKIMAPYSKGMDDGEHLTVVGGVVAFGGVELPGFEGNGLKAVTLVLEKNGTNGVVGGVGVYNKGKIGVG